MSTETKHIGLVKDEPSEFYDIGRVNDNLDKIDGALGDMGEMKTASGSGTEIALTVPSIKSYRGNL